jgi:peptidoglycan/LPS O-acetylase OafA/YrhL
LLRARTQASTWTQLRAIAALALTSLALRAALAGSVTAAFHGPVNTLMVTLPGLLDWFAIGMSLAVLRAELEVGRATRSLPAALARRPGLCVLLSFAAFMAAVPSQQGDLFLTSYGLATHIAIGLGSGLLVLAVVVPRPAGRHPWPLRALRHRLTGWVGLVSYGVYLWHLPLLMLICSQVGLAPASGAVGEVVVLWVAVLVGGVLLGAASWYLIERPVQRRFASRTDGRHRHNARGRVSDVDTGVHSTLDPLNSSGVAVDHLA